MSRYKLHKCKKCGNTYRKQGYGSYLTKDCPKCRRLFDDATMEQLLTKYYYEEEIPDDV